MKTIRVVAALIFHEGKLFATQRGYGAWRDYFSHVCDVEYDYPEFHLSMQCFRCEITSGEPKLLEHEAAKWLGREELDTVDWLPADWNILPDIKKNWPAE